MSDFRDAEGEPAALVRIAALVADGELVDWDSEMARSPELAGEIGDLRWLEAVTISRRAAVREFAGPSASLGSPPVTGTKTLRTSGASVPPEAPADSGSARSGSLLAAGSRWGHLEVAQLIGRGAVGEVYRAFDSVLGRDVALKVWHESASYRTTGTEARRLGKIRHAGVVPVHGFERHGGVAGMWIDFLDGRSLEDLLAERGPFDLLEVCEIGVALCEALEAVHGAGVVHRDLKASNVMRLVDGSVVLIDFGSAKELPRGVPERTAHLRGTPLATAPELFRGDPVGPSADIYSMGVLLYRLVTLRYPVEARSFGELVEKLERQEMVPLSERRPDLDARFLVLVDRALATRPADRPRTAPEMRRVLREIVEAKPAG